MKMTSILDDINTIMDDGDIRLIKEKIFKRLNGQGISSCELIEVYTLMQLDIPFEDIDYLIAEGKCIEIPRAIKTTAPKCWNDPILGANICLPSVSDLKLCKEYMFDKELFYSKYNTNISYYDHDQSARYSLDNHIMCCYLSFSPELELEYMDYIKNNKKNKQNIWTNMFDQLGTTSKPLTGKSSLVWKETPISGSISVNNGHGVSSDAAAIKAVKDDLIYGGI